jgi:hypothetical protein
LILSKIALILSSDYFPVNTFWTVTVDVWTGPVNVWTVTVGLGFGCSFCRVLDSGTASGGSFQ